MVKIKSLTEKNIDQELINMTEGKVRKVMKLLLYDKEIHALQEYANTVSIKRLGYNDHGPVHMRKVAYNAIKMFEILKNAKIKLSLENEEAGNVDDSKVSVLMSAFLHDIGMSVGRDNHEISSAILAGPILDRILNEVYKDDIASISIIKATAFEGIMGHMAQQKIHSLESGIVLVADGCDMEKGRARIPMMLNNKSKVGDIHKYSSSAIENVTIEKGNIKPIKITIEMSASVGFFQVEEVLFSKIEASTIKRFIELYAFVKGRDIKKYL